MASSKKNLLAKLKKDMSSSKKTSKSKMPPPTIIGDDSLSIEHVHLQLVQRILDLYQDDEAYKTVIQEHINFYPQDKILSKILDLSKDLRYTLFIQIKNSSPIHLSDSIQSFLENTSTKSSSEYVELPIFNQLQLLYDSTDSITVHQLILLENDIFDSLLLCEFYSNETENIYCRDLIADLLTHKKSNISSLTKIVEQFNYIHRNDQLFQILENDSISHDEKQDFVREYIQNQYELTRSKQFFILIWTLIENKTYPFKKQLDALLFRFVPDKKFLPQIRKHLTLALDVLIHKNKTDKYLSKFFLTKQGLYKFKDRILPQLEDSKKSIRYIRSLIRQEFEQPYLYRHASKIHWKTYLDIIKNKNASSLLTIESELFNIIQNNRSEYTKKILKELDNEKSELKIIRNLIQQFISTFKPNERKVLGKLLLVPKSEIKKFFTESALDDYMNVIKTIDPPIDENPKDMIVKTDKKTIKTHVDWTQIRNDYQMYLEKNRLEIINFSFVLIEIIDDAAREYIFETYDASKFIPNENFYRHCVQRTCTQKNTIFEIDGVKMKVYYYLSTKEIVVQDENLYASHIQFVSNQCQLWEASTPAEYILYFVKLPILNHKSETINKLRQHIYNQILQFNLPLAQEIENNIYYQSSTLQDYLKSISRLFLIIDNINSTFFSQSSYFKTIVRNGYLNIANIFNLLNGSLEFSMHFLFPEYFTAPSTIQPLLLQKARIVSQKIYKSFILRAFVIDNPMSRLPIFPTEIDILPVELNKLVFLTNTDILYGFENESFNNVDIKNGFKFAEISAYLNETASPVDDAIIDSTTTTSSPSISTEKDSISDPLSSFYDIALKYLDELV